MSRTKRFALLGAGSGFALCLFAVILLQIDAVRMSGTHEFLHRTGMAFMLVGLLVFLGANVAQRRRERLLRISRALRGSPVFMPETIRTLQLVGGALMALAIGAEMAVIIVHVVPHLRGVSLVLLGVPGALIWLIGIVGGAIAAISARLNVPPRLRRDEPVRARLVYEEWSEPRDEMLKVEAEH
jgi:hypothetical protein